MLTINTKIQKGYYVISQDIEEIKEILRYGRKSFELLDGFLYFFPWFQFYYLLTYIIVFQVGNN